MTSNIDWQTIVATLPTSTTGSNPINIYARYEYTNGAVSDQYNQYLQQIAAIYNQPSPVTFTQADLDSLKTAVAGLYNLAANGVVVDGKTWYLSTEMASNLDSLLRTFISVGFQVSQSGITGVTSGSVSNADMLIALQQWKDLSITSPVIGQLLKVGLDIKNTNRTLQAMIELDYVKTANGLINEKLGSLEEALGATSDILNTLAAIQDIHNKIAVSSKSSINFNYTNQGLSAKDYLNSYLKVASIYFGKPISVKLGFNILENRYSFTQGFISGVSYDILGNPVNVYGPPISVIAGVQISQIGKNYVENLIKLKASVQAQITKLDGILSTEQKNATGSIYQALVNIKNDLDSKFTNNAGQPITLASGGADQLIGLSKWILDGYNDNDSSNSALIQQNITKAITAAQSLNDTQKEEVRNYLFVFEEYYKSASSILQKISQIIEKMAQGARS